MTITQTHDRDQAPATVSGLTPLPATYPPTQQAGPESATALSLTPTVGGPAESNPQSDMQMTSTDEQAPHIAAIRRSMDAGFQFLHLPDTDGQDLAAIYAERTRGGVVETYSVRSMDEAIAARFRVDDYPDGDPLWQRHGTVEEVVTALLEPAPPSAPEAPNRSHPRPSRLWLPGEG
jgi:hypothetical protein